MAVPGTRRLGGSTERPPVGRAVVENVDSMSWKGGGRRVIIGHVQY